MRLTWDERYAQLAAFHAKHGHTKVTRFAPKPPGLGHWLANQRRALATGRLTRAQTRSLAALGVTASERVDRWERRFAELARFVQRHGHAKVPPSPTTPLSVWVEWQRATARSGRLDPARRKRLEALGFVWNAKHIKAAWHWEAMLQRLKEFRREHGHCNVPIRTPRDRALASWARRQRALHKRGALEESRRVRLDALGFVWDVKDALWEEMFQRVLDYRAATGRWSARTGSRLQRWMSGQRTKRRAGTLRPDRRAKLDAAGFDWAPLPPRRRR